MMTCSRDGVADCGMAGRVQSTGKVAPGWGASHLLHTQSEEGSCICHCSKQADEGRSEPLPGCTDSGAPACRGGGMYPPYSFGDWPRKDTWRAPSLRRAQHVPHQPACTASRYGPEVCGRSAALPWSSHS